MIAHILDDRKTKITIPSFNLFESGDALFVMETIYFNESYSLIYFFRCITWTLTKAKTFQQWNPGSHQGGRGMDGWKEGRKEDRRVVVNAHN